MPSPIWATVVVLFLAQWLGLLVVAVYGAKKPAETLTWLTVCVLVPLLGVPLYFILTGRVPKRSNLPWMTVHSRSRTVMLTGARQKTVQETEWHSSPDTGTGSDTRHRIHDAIYGFASRCHRVQMQTFHSGDTFYQAMLQDMNRAKSSIDVEFYIFRYDEVGRAIVNVLSEKARSGVKVRFLRDGLGSRNFPQSVIRSLQQSGVECRVFFPLRAPFVTRQVNHRDHCKIVVIDERIAYTGGMNVGREYAGRDPKYGPWRDTSARVVTEGRVPLLDLFEANFDIAEHEMSKKTDRKMKPRSFRENVTANADLTSEARALAHVGPLETAEHGQTPSESQGDLKQTLYGEVQFVQSGPDTQQNLRELYFLCLTQATYQVEITTPYFLPESDLMMALKTAVARGVKVRLMLPERVDHRIVGMACQTYFPSLLEAGVEIYLHRPGVLHAKVMTVDRDVAIVGAANYDLRSFRLNYEVCLVQYGSAVTEQLRNQFERDLLVSRRLLQQDLHTSLISNVKHLTARLAAPLC